MKTPNPAHSLSVDNDNSITVELYNIDDNSSICVFQSYYVPRIGEGFFIADNNSVSWKEIHFYGRVFDVRYKWGPESRRMVVRVYLSPANYDRP
jgi:hypothetical protein